MLTLTPLHRAILNALDTCEHGAGDTELCAQFQPPINHEALLQAISDLCGEELIDARFRDDLQDCAASEDPIIYSLSETGATALWAMMRFEYVALPRHIHFADRAAMREYLRSAA